MLSVTICLIYFAKIINNKNYKYIFSHQRKENRNFSQKAYKTQKHLAKFSAR